MVADLVWGRLLLMSSAKSSVHGSLSNHALQLVCGCHVFLAATLQKGQHQKSEVLTKFETLVKVLTNL